MLKLPACNFRALAFRFLRDAPLDIWGGGAKCFVACELFFYLREKTIFFLSDQRPTIFFLCFVEEIFCRMLSLLCTLPCGVFSGKHIFHQFRQQTFFSDFCGDKLFFSIFSSQPPPPQILNGASLKKKCFFPAQSQKSLFSIGRKRHIGLIYISNKLYLIISF